VSDLQKITFDFVAKMDVPDVSDLVSAKWMENWDIPDPAEGGIEEFRRVREMLAQRVKELRRHPALAARQEDPEHAEHG
jgi:protein-tyrosine-phosphatase